MRVDLLLPGLLWPHDDGADVMRAPEATTLERWLARGTTVPEPELRVAEWLWNRFTNTDAPDPATGTPGASSARDLPIAPVTFALDGGRPGARYWMRADPVHFIVTRTGLRLAPEHALDLSDEEAAALAATIGAHFADAPRFALHAPNARRWYLGADTPFDLATTAPSIAQGGDVDHGLPQGAHRLEWVAFLNEVQMLWFEHPVNLAREQRGEPVASSLWLHGPGRLPPPGKPRHTHTAGGDGLLAALAALTDRPHRTTDT
ncbi:MAG: hypothetical protein H7125_07940, partial [Proteobacteria bacterium]|nr:hypothetical protein [Burkholderiales bacterium]